MLKLILQKNLDFKIYIFCCFCCVLNNGFTMFTLYMTCYHENGEIENDYMYNVPGILESQNLPQKRLPATIARNSTL